MHSLLGVLMGLGVFGFGRRQSFQVFMNALVLEGTILAFASASGLDRRDGLSFALRVAPLVSAAMVIFYSWFQPRKILHSVACAPCYIARQYLGAGYRRDRANIRQSRVLPVLPEEEAKSTVAWIVESFKRVKHSLAESSVGKSFKRAQQSLAESSFVGSFSRASRGSAKKKPLDIDDLISIPPDPMNDFHHTTSVSNQAKGHRCRSILMEVEESERAEKAEKAEKVERSEKADELVVSKGAVSKPSLTDLEGTAGAPSSVVRKVRMADDLPSPTRSTRSMHGIGHARIEGPDDDDLPSPTRSMPGTGHARIEAPDATNVVELSEGSVSKRRGLWSFKRSRKALPTLESYDADSPDNQRHSTESSFSSSFHSSFKRVLNLARFSSRGGAADVTHPGFVQTRISRSTSQNYASSSSKLSIFDTQPSVLSQVFSDDREKSADAQLSVSDIENPNSAAVATPNSAEDSVVVPYDANATPPTQKQPSISKRSLSPSKNVKNAPSTTSLEQSADGSTPIFVQTRISRRESSGSRYAMTLSEAQTRINRCGSCERQEDSLTTSEAPSQAYRQNILSELVGDNNGTAGKDDVAEGSTTLTASRPPSQSPRRIDPPSSWRGANLQPIVRTSRGPSSTVVAAIPKRPPLAPAPSSGTIPRARQPSPPPSPPTSSIETRPMGAKAAAARTASIPVDAVHFPPKWRQRVLASLCGWAANLVFMLVGLVGFAFSTCGMQREPNDDLGAIPTEGDLLVMWVISATTRFALIEPIFILLMWGLPYWRARSRRARVKNTVARF